MTIAEIPEPEAFGSPAEDLFVKAVTVQGGEAHIGGEKTAFARIIMTGVDLKHVSSDGSAPRRQQSAVLRLEAAAAFAAELRNILNEMVRSTPTPTVPAAGAWSWSSVPPHAEELLVAEASANGTAIAVADGTRPTVRVDFTGILVRGLSLTAPPVHVQGAIFSGPRQVQALISSLRKVVNSALEQQRLDIYVSGQQPLSAFGF